MITLATIVTNDFASDQAESLQNPETVKSFWIFFITFMVLIFWFAWGVRKWDGKTNGSGFSSE